MIPTSSSYDTIVKTGRMYTMSFELSFIHFPMISGNIANLNIQAGNCLRLYLFVLESRGKERIPKHLQILALILDSMLHVIYLLCLRGDVKREFSEEVEILSQVGARGTLDHT